MGKRGRPKHPDILTPREWEVLELIREGLSNVEIGSRLGISIDGVKYHVTEILGKLELENRHQAAAWTPEQRPWWQSAGVLLSIPRPRLDWLSPAVTGALAVVVVAGIGLLVWALLATRGDTGALGATAYQFSYEHGDGSLWLVNADGSNLTNLDGPALRPGEDCGGMTWSPSGHRFSCVREDRVELFSDDGEQVGVSDEFLYDEGGGLPPEPWWAPDGQHFLILSSDGPGTRPLLTIVNDDARIVAKLGPVDLTGTAYARAATPLWSSTGDRIAYRTRDGETRIYSLSSGDEQTVSGDYHPMGWALVDSSLIVATNYEPTPTIANTVGSGVLPSSYSVGLLELDSGVFSPITELDNSTQFWISPDGSRVAKVTRSDDGPGLALVTFPGGAVTPIPDSRIIFGPTYLRQSQVAFSPDSKELYWVNAGPAAVYRASTAGTDLTKLGEVQGGPRQPLS